MPPAPPSEAQLYQHSAELLGIHEALLKDSVRNRAFREALALHVTSGSAVLDIGSGTGLWAILAAKLGARRVVAIERDPLMCGVIRMLAIANGVEIEVIHGDARSVSLPRHFDIVVSETVGHVIFDEDIVSVMIDARERFLKPGGVMIPERVALLAAPVHLDEAASPWPHEVDVEYQLFHSLALHRPVPFLDKSGFRHLSAPQTLVESDMAAAAAPPDLRQLAATWEIHEAASLTGIAVWVEMHLSGRIILSTLDTPSWSATLYRLAPFTAAGGQLDFELELNTTTNVWTATLGGQRQQFSPAIAATRLALLQCTDSPLPIHGGGPVFA